MARQKNENIIVGLDIGTTKICAIVGEVKEFGVDIIGLGSSPSRGLKKGVVINIDATVASIKRAIDEAELMAGCEIKSVYAGIAGAHVNGFNSHGVVAVKDNEVRESDVRRVIDAAKAVVIPADREVLHILPQEFIIDDQGGIREPLGMSGVRLECKIHLVTGAVTSAQNIVKCAQRCDLTVMDIVLEQLASSIAVLSDDEKELGVALVDIGGGTTDIAIFCNGSIQYTSVIPIGGQHLTNDIAIGLRTPQENAEELKKKFGSATALNIGKDEVINVASIGTRPDRILPRHILSDILQPRVEEIFELVAQEIGQLKLTELLASGIVLTGGSTLLPGMVEIAEDITGLPVRVGSPRGVGGLVDIVNNPVYATGVGLVLYGAKDTNKKYFRDSGDNLYSKVKRRMGAWLQDMI